INRVTYGGSTRRETLTATFTQPDGGVTVTGFQCLVLLLLPGRGHAFFPYTTLFRSMLTSSRSAPRHGWDGGYYQLTFGTSPLAASSLDNNAERFHDGNLPPYTPAHDYTFVLDTRLGVPAQLHFGVSDGGYSDNTGAY